MTNFSAAVLGDLIGFLCNKRRSSVAFEIDYYHMWQTSRWRCVEHCWDDAECRFRNYDYAAQTCYFGRESDRPATYTGPDPICVKESECYVSSKM